uniref:18 kDa Sin3-associated polypeptide n=1 Tax=Caenorhabditis japonica TaxID=281687 RepID=A0A8R1HN45_CAEJA
MSNGQVVSQVAVSQDKPLDREKLCPMLLRVFCANNRHNPVSEYNNRNGGSVPANELQMYTWMDCSLRELTSLIKEVNPDARRKGTTFDFAIIQADRTSTRYILRDIGNTMNGQRGIDDHKTLQQCKFEVGDFVDVAITMPNQQRRFNNHGDRRDFDRRPRSPIR